jgi:hypothetical protein
MHPHHGTAVSTQRMHPTTQQLVLLLVLQLLLLPFQSLAEAHTDFPPLIESDDIAYFFENDDLDGLHWALTNIFRNSERNPNATEVMHKLPEKIISRGGGLTYTTKYKLQMDLEQVEYLAEQSSSRNDQEVRSDFFASTVKPLYKSVLKNIPPLDQLKQTEGLYAFRPTDNSSMAQVYNKALHQTNFDELKDKNGNLVPLLNQKLNIEHIEQQWLGLDSQHANPGIVVIDDLLSKEALHRIRQLMLESTVWYQTKMPLRFGGYVGACEFFLAAANTLVLCTYSHQGQPHGWFADVPFVTCRT